MDLNKYDLPKEQKPKLNDWKESVSVVVLSVALKIVGKKHGIKLTVDEDNRPTLSFHPGFGLADMNTRRHDIAEQVKDLFLSAAEDLQELICAGKITLPQSTYRRPSCR